MPQSLDDVMLTGDERAELERYARAGAGVPTCAPGPGLVLSGDGHSYAEVTAAVGWSSATIAKWKARFIADRLRVVGPPSGLATDPHAGTRSARSGVDAQNAAPWRHALVDADARHAAQALAHDGGAIWKRAGLQPHRLERYMRSTDPDFESKAADVIGLYLQPPQHAVVFCVDEKTAIQALDRRDPILPLSPGRAERHGFEYFRHGTLSLYAALNTGTGEVIGETAERHTSAEFVAFLSTVVATQPADARFTSSRQPLGA